MEEPLMTRHVTIRGKVQGVSYRAWCVAKAEACGVHGWVRNRRDGTVEALFSGSASAVGAMLAACWDGPPAARVEDVQAASAQAPAISGFAAAASV